MSINLKFIEEIELPCKVITSNSCELSENGHISVATNSTLHIYHIQHQKENVSPSLSIKKYTISPSDFILALNVGVDINNILLELPQHLFYEGILSTELSPKLTGGSPVEPRFIKSLWSPAIINDYDCVLAALSNTGSLEIIAKTCNVFFYEQFKSICNISERYTAMCKQTWQNSENMSPLQQYNELKHRVKETLPTAFIWSGRISTYCILIVAHACGDISFWKVSVVKSKKLEYPDITFMNVININLPNITALKWITVGNNALLFVGNSKGQVSCLKLTNLEKEKVVSNGELHIWTQADEIAVQDIIFFTHMINSYVVIVKGSDLIILLLNESLGKFDSYVFHVGNIQISAVKIVEENKLLVVSINGATKELIIDCENSKINVKWKHLYVNINWYIYQALNFMSSINKTLFIFLIGPCKTADRKDDKDLNSLVVFFNTAKDPLQILLDNPSNSLKDNWDCLETLRCQILLDKQLPSRIINLEKDCDNLFFCKLRLLLLLSRMSEVIYEQTGNINTLTKSYEDVLQIFSIKMATSRILHLLKLYEAKDELTAFQLHNIYVLNSFLKQIVAEDWIIKLELGDSIINLLFNIILRANNVDYPSIPNCLRCDDRLMGITCQPAHFDMKCSISFMQIAKYPDIRCLLCGSIAHSEMEKEYDILMCPHCRIPMIKRE